MNISEDQLKQIFEYAGLFLSPEEIAVLIDVEVQPFITAVKSKKGEIYLQYMKGKTESKRAIRENVIKMAKHGSPQAEDLAEKYITEQKIAEKNAGR
jgi:hypothetical protein